MPRRNLLRTALLAPPFAIGASQIAKAQELPDPQMDQMAPMAMPSLKFTTAAGKPITLKDFKGKFILLNIWATWCGPCREEMPTLDRLQAKLGSAHFQVVPLSVDAGGLAAVQQFYQEIRIKHLGIYLNISGNAMDNLNLAGIPASYLINPEGLQIGSLAGAADWSSTSSITFFRKAVAAP
ncbi:MAG: hypothetical protein B7Z71_05210 [Acidocella sp. 21-58-7]|nr:MAG: hypothetical protein B7Z76_13605 [Acidiphilium sp. 20-67-58]OYV61083.1 MAG: hypothetical protein B7Z71_05210 [Acidocella sp. 21-58-7]